MYVRLPSREVEQTIGYTRQKLKKESSVCVGIYQLFKAIKLNERVRVEKE